MPKKSTAKPSTKIHELDATVAEVVLSCMEKRKRSKALKEEAEAIEAEVKETLTLIMPAYGLEKIQNNDGDTISYANSSRTTLDKDKLKLELVSRGVATTVVAESIEASSKVSQFVTVTYRQHKE